MCESLIGINAKKRVLVVDDSPLNRKMLLKIVIKQGFEADEVDDGDVAVQRVSEMMRVLKQLGTITKQKKKTRLSFFNRSSFLVGSMKKSSGTVPTITLSNSKSIDLVNQSSNTYKDSNSNSNIPEEGNSDYKSHSNSSESGGHCHTIVASLDHNNHDSHDDIEKAIVKNSTFDSYDDVQKTIKTQQKHSWMPTHGLFSELFSHGSNSTKFNRSISIDRTVSRDNSNSTNPTFTLLSDLTMYDIILMDFVMERMNGPEAVKIMRDLGFNGK